MPRNSFLLPVIFFTVLLVIAGCGGGETTVMKSSPSGGSMQEFFGKYEKSFNPSDYDAEVNLVEQEAQRQSDSAEAALISATAVPETIPGFRIQLLFTQEIDQANDLKEDVSSNLPEAWVYVVYDAPYYKVRVGNFADRADAAPVVRKLVELGYKDAWVVPDNIIKNPPPRPPDYFIEPEKH